MTDAARAWLASHGYDPIYGARPLRRLVQTAIGDRLARALLGGEIRDGDTVVVDRPRRRRRAHGDRAPITAPRGDRCRPRSRSCPGTRGPRLDRGRTA